MIYNEIYNLCKIRDFNKKQYSNRAKFIVSLLDKHNIEYKIIRTLSEKFNKYFYNIFCFGSSNKFLSAHYDVANIHVDNANDNSASVINAISYKLKNPSINLIILDGEEPPFMGMGSKYASLYLKKYNISVKWILNLELTGVGEYFFIDKYDTNLAKGILNNFSNAFSVSTPFNDAYIFRQYGIESNVITTINLEDDKPDMKILYHSHSIEDSIDKISTNDMKNFVDNVIDKIVHTC
jgi:hypothetical protein